MTSSNSDNWILDGVIIGQLRTGIEDVFEIVSIQTPREAPKGTILFLGRLLNQNSEIVFDHIEARWRSLEYTPMLRQHKDGHIALIAQPGIVEPKPANPLINLGLAIATILSVWFTGAVYECQCTPTSLQDWLSGLPMMLALMIILLAHEFGHYFAAKYHKVHVTLPYFIPLPLISPVGTLGAFIQLKTPFKTKRQLFDIGIAGPIGGLIFAVPLLFWGMATSEVHQLTRGEEATSVLEGNSVFYLGTKYLIHGDLLPSFDQYANLPFAQEFALLLVGWLPSGGGTDVLINSVAFAAWFGLFITAMNLLPVGQLDGGHIVYSLIGDAARWLGTTLIVVMVLAGFWWSGWWVWSFLVFFVIGVKHPPPLNDLVPISTGRKVLAYLIILAFIILFMPNPLQPL